jgi:hypothetical protein
MPARGPPAPSKNQYCDENGNGDQREPFGHWYLLLRTGCYGDAIIWKRPGHVPEFPLPGHWIKSKNPNAPGVKREAEEDGAKCPKGHRCASQ